MAGHAGYLKLLDEMRELHCRKSADYGRGSDPFANCRASADFGMPAWVGVMVRAGDKMHRIKSFIANGNLANESVEDSLMDLAAYALIALTLRREEQAAATVPIAAAPSDARKRIYIAGPISKGDLAANINQATDAFIELAQQGFAPLCPHWSAYSKPVYQIGSDVYCLATRSGNDRLSHADWMGIDLPWVAVADAVLRLPGESTGADREVEEATRRGIPVFTSLDDLLLHFDPTRQAA